ncbi:hypothetical protein [Clostridium estertheticum]|uniref:hypothetical protein n=1 Tax=Clostridium estertheticum TaxID=238834 RepID=UPI001C0D80A8|nr:hypothetical protein [Clostridium estertheticum]MBU3185638.1 hypothetical protein [Clostridium estertheticum]
MNETNSKEALQYLVGVGEDKFKIFTATNGFEYTTNNILRVKDPTPSSIVSSTLTSLVDYIKGNIDELGKMIIQVESPTKVLLSSELKKDKHREEYMLCEAVTPRIQFDNFIETERFNVMLQSNFVVNQCIEQLLVVTGSIKDEAVKQIGDDGISQSVTVKTGVATVGAVLVPNPVILAPYRTFPEIVQPESKFIFRMKSGPTAAIIEADGGAWRNKAMDSIKVFLKAELVDIKNLTIIS